jgi:hypothetical protein
VGGEGRIPLTAELTSSSQRKSFNLVTAFTTRRGSIRRFMYDLETPMTNNQGKRDLNTYR